MKQLKPNKHIRKKSLGERPISEEINFDLEQHARTVPLDAVHKIPSGTIPFVTTDDNKFFQAFIFQHTGKKFLVPEPDPILVYYHAAYMQYIRLETLKREFLQQVCVDILTEAKIKQLYDFFGTASGCIILLFTAVEASVNRIIPADFTYQKELPRKTEVFSKSQIEWLPFMDKVKIILPKASGKDFVKAFPMKAQHLTNLKLFRDAIVHTKEGEEYRTYDSLYKTALTFNYDQAMMVVRDYCNYYISDDFIEDGNCSQDW